MPELDFFDRQSRRYFDGLYFNFGHHLVCQRFIQDKNIAPFLKSPTTPPPILTTETRPQNISWKFSAEEPPFLSNSLCL